jgi:membrane protein YqaA with SNARE-associated domain
VLKKLTQKCLGLAKSKYSEYVLALISFSESSFFPIPPDIIIVPMVVAKKESYKKIFLIATIFSSLGGLLGYFIGLFFLDISMIVIEFYGYEQKVFKLQENLSSKGGLLLWLGTLFLAGFTPLPFKVFTITSGIVNFNLAIFFIVCLVSRGLRFFIVSYLSMKFGENFIYIFEKNGAKWFASLGISILIFGLIIYFLI